MWFTYFAALPYDATYCLEALLDCVHYCMEQQHLEERYMIDIVQVGFGFANRAARRMWVQTLENLLFNFNQQTKFMMIPEQRPEAIQTLASFSHFRCPLSLSSGAPHFHVFSEDTQRMRQEKTLLLYFRYFSMPSAG